jgi:uncharacterized protein involved in exopolysaccharide biosynthesis
MSISAEPTPAAENDLYELFRLLWRHKLIIVACALVSGGVAVFRALTATEMFRAEATVTEVSNQQLGAAGALANQFGGLASLVGVNLGNFGGGGREAQALLKSRKICEEFVLRNKLIPILYENSEKPPTLWMAVRHFRDDILSIREDKRINLTVVTMTWKDPKVAAAWANKFVALTNEMMRARAITDSQAAIEYLNKQIANINEVEVKKVMYGLIESETKTLMLANVRAEYALTVVDPAVAPDLRFSPHRTIMVILGLAIGGVVGVLVVLGLHLTRQAKARTAQLRMPA